MWTSKRKIETLSLWGKSWYRKESLKILRGYRKEEFPRLTTSRNFMYLCIGGGETIAGRGL